MGIDVLACYPSFCVDYKFSIRYYENEVNVNRIDKRFSALKAEGRKAFVAYITAGDPTLESTARLVREFDRCGVDIIELGVPFSDPVADGPVNQEAAMRALRNDVSVGNILDTIRLIRSDCDIPIIFFAYYNTILAHGLERFVKEAKTSGLDGALLLDLPPEEAREYKKLMDAHGLATIFLVSPVTPDDRLKTIASNATGFVYYVSQMGVTGERKNVAVDLSEHIAKIRSHTETPVVVGFGISSPDHVREAARFADGVVVGSSIVRRIGENGGKTGFEKDVGEYVGSLTAALHGG